MRVRKLKPNFAIYSHHTIVAVVTALIVCLSTHSLAGELGDTGAEVYEETCNKCHGLITQDSSWLNYLPEDGSKVQVAVILARGPTLNGIVNRPVASIEGYLYSKAMRAFSETGAIWDRKRLDAFLTDSRAMIKGYMVLKMEEDDRKLVLDYLTNFAQYEP